MTLSVIEQILEIQIYSVANIKIEAGVIRLECKRKEATYCCPICKQQTFSRYDSSRRVIKDLTMSGKRVFVELPVYRLYCSSCKKVATEYLPFLPPHHRHTNRFIAFIHILNKYFYNSSLLAIGQKLPFDLKPFSALPFRSHGC